MFQQFGLQNTSTKIFGGKIYSLTRTFGAKVHKSDIRVERWHDKYDKTFLQIICLSSAIVLHYGRGKSFWDTLIIKN